MICMEVLGNLRDLDIAGKHIERVKLQWFEADKRLLSKMTDKGTRISIRLNSPKRLQQGDVIYARSHKMIAIEVAPAEAMVFEPQTVIDAAGICYQLGNRHIQIFLEGNQILAPYDPVVAKMFNKMNVPFKVERRRMENAIQAGNGHHH